MLIFDASELTMTSSSLFVTILLSSLGAAFALASAAAAAAAAPIECF